jgi:nucleoid-associated protein YgaU
MAKYSANNTGDIVTKSNKYYTVTSKEYTVKRGDTFYSIALAIMGDERLWTIIADLNAPREPFSLVAGDVIKIPTVVNVL